MLASIILFAGKKKNLHFAKLKKQIRDNAYAILLSFVNI